jgi:hypothetical protein
MDAIIEERSSSLFLANVRNDSGVYYRVPYLDMIVSSKGKNYRGCDLCRQRLHSRSKLL